MQLMQMQLTFQEGLMMKKLFMVAMAAVFSMTMVSSGFAQGTSGTMEKKDDKKADAPADKMEKKADKKAAKTAKKKAANPCAAKGDMKGEAKDAAKADAPKTDAKK